MVRIRTGHGYAETKLTYVVTWTGWKVVTRALSGRGATAARVDLKPARGRENAIKRRAGFNTAKSSYEYVHVRELEFTGGAKGPRESSSRGGWGGLF